MSKNIAIPNHIAKFVEGLQLTPVDQLPGLTPEKRVDAAGFGLKLELAGKLYAGFALLGLKDEMGHGMYMAELAKRSIPARSASRCVSLAMLATRVPASNWPTLANLEPSKLELITGWEDKEIKTFCKGDEVRGITIDDATESSVRELNGLLKQANLSNNELAQQNEKLTKLLARTEEKNKLLTKKNLEPEGFIYPASVEKVRIESSVLASLATTCIDDLEQHMIDLTQASDLSKDKNKQLAEFGAGATALYLNIKAIQSKASYLLTWFIESIGEDYVTDDPESIPTMTEQEALRIKSMHEVMLSQHRAEQLARESKRKSHRRSKGNKK